MNNTLPEVKEGLRNISYKIDNLPETYQLTYNDVNNDINEWFEKEFNDYPVPDFNKMMSDTSYTNAKWYTEKIGDEAPYFIPVDDDKF